jgi:hypothetical protein
MMLRRLAVQRCTSHESHHHTHPTDDQSLAMLPINIFMIKETRAEGLLIGEPILTQKAGMQGNIVNENYF